jgi:hypothetical protein
VIVIAGIAAVLVMIAIAFSNMKILPGAPGKP